MADQDQSAQRDEPHGAPAAATEVRRLSNPNLVLWNGQLRTRRQLTQRGLSYIGAPSLWITLLLLLPSLVLVVIAFTPRDPLGGDIVWSFTLENFKRLAGLGTDTWNSDFVIILWRSLVLAGVTTALCLLLAYPLSFFIASRSKRGRSVLLALVMVPFCTNMVIRTYAWRLLFSNQLPLAKLAAWVGLIDEGQSLYPSPFAVYVGMLTTFLPFAVLPIYTNVERLDWSIVEAAQDLYGGKWRVFRHAILPQTSAGLMVALILTFIPAMGTFVVPDLLSGANYMLVGTLIGHEFRTVRDLPFGSALSVVLMLMTLVGLFALRRRVRKMEPTT